MTLPHTVSEVLAEHVLFEVECIDRMYLNVYVPKLQYPLGVVGYVRNQLGLPVSSTAPLAKLTATFGAAMHRFADAQGVPWVQFVKGQRKDEVMHEHLAGFEAAGRTEGVLFVGRAQEKARMCRTERRHNSDGSSYPWVVASTGVVNQFYVYAVDADFGPFFIKFCSYFPYNAKLCINGHEWAKRQAAKAGVGFDALDNAFGRVDDEDLPALQAICDRLDEAHIDALLRKWLAVLPHPFSAADRAAGYRYDISILQAEFALTQVLDRPVSGRIFFEQVIRDNLDIGRPDKVGWCFTGASAAGPSVRPGPVPDPGVDLRGHPEPARKGRALRTETTINETRDFGIGKRLTNLPALREIGFSANRRLLGVEQLSHDPITGADAFAAVNNAVTTKEGTRVAGLRFGDPRAQALLAALLVFRLLPHGFTNADLRPLVAEVLGKNPTGISAGQMTYDLRRLRAHGLITRTPGTHRYRLTDTGLHHALFLTRAHDRLLRTGLAQLDEATPGSLRAASHAYRHAIDDLTRQAGLAA